MIKAYRSIYEVVGGRFTLTRFELDKKNGRQLVRKTYKKGEQFTAYNYEVPAGFMDLLRVVGPAPDAPDVPPPKGEVRTDDQDGVVGKESRREPEPPEKKEKPPRPTRPTRRRR